MNRESSTEDKRRKTPEDDIPTKEEIRKKDGKARQKETVEPKKKEKRDGQDKRKEATAKARRRNLRLAQKIADRQTEPRTTKHPRSRANPREEKQAPR